MELKISQYDPGNRPPVELPSAEMYRLLGEDGIRRLVSDHYDLLKSSDVSHLFPDDEAGLAKAKKHASDFFVQICGGPMYFNKNRGRPMLYKRHLPHQITSQSRVTWLECYRQVLLQRDLPEPVLYSFWQYINNFSAWMINS